MLRKTYMFIVVSIIACVAACNAITSQSNLTSPTKSDIVTIEQATSNQIPTSTSTSSKMVASVPPASATPESAQILPPSLSNELTRGCEEKGQKAKGPDVNDQAIEFSLQDVSGNTYTLSELLLEKPVYMIFGSFT